MNFKKILKNVIKKIKYLYVGCQEDELLIWKRKNGARI